jgi:hypothetical protein
MISCPGRVFLAATLVVGLALFASEAGAEGRVIIQPHLEGGRGQTPNNDVEFKVRDSDGNLVSRGWISPGDGQNTATVDLPPGDYTIETYSDRDDGSRIGGKKDVKVEDGKTHGQQVELDPLTPQEDLQEQVEDLEDRIDDLEDQIEHIEEDIAEHKKNGEDDAVEQHEQEIDRLKENIERKQRQLRRKRAQLAAVRRAQKAASDTPDAPHMKVPTVPMQNQGPKGGGKKY